MGTHVDQIKVKAQYEKYVYPPVILDMAEAIASGYYDFHCPRLFLPLYWPDGRSLNNLKVLIAGCGTNQSAYYAMMLPHAEVVGIDISAESLTHARYLKNKHNLTNLRLENIAIQSVASLNTEFDLIVSTGVLHHLPNPSEGLACLKSVLAQQGQMSLMLYGSSLRVGVYMVQRALRELGIESQEESDLLLLGEILDLVDPMHPVKKYIKVAKDLKYQTGLVDTFLHPVDQAYTPTTLMKLIENADLQFKDWLDPIFYDYRVQFAGHPLLLEKCKHLRPEAVWAAIDLIKQNRGTHRFIVCHPGNSDARKSPDFDTNEFLAWFVSKRHGLRYVGESNSLDHSLLQRQGHKWKLNSLQQKIMHQINGQLTLKEIFAYLKISQGSDDFYAAARFLSAMKKQGNLLFSTFKIRSEGI